MTLDFNCSEGKMFFEFVYEGFVIGGSLERNKGMLVLRREIRILDKLESVSYPKPCGKKLPVNEEPARQLNDATNTGPLSMNFDSEELALIKRYMSLVPWSTGSAVRNFMKTYDWIEQQENEQETERPSARVS